MKIIKRVRYQRVRYSQLEDGDHYKTISGSQTTKRTSEWDEIHRANGLVVIALDTNKYRPEVTWEIIEITDDEMNDIVLQRWYVVNKAYEQGYETIYE